MLLRPYYLVMADDNTTHFALKVSVHPYVFLKLPRDRNFRYGKRYYLFLSECFSFTLSLSLSLSLSDKKKSIIQKRKKNYKLLIYELQIRFFN